MATNSYRSILNLRTDVTDYLIHWTKGSNFKLILESGYLYATRAVRKVSDGDRWTIQGP